MSVTVVIPAAGAGIRMGTPLPKQYMKVHGKELIVYTMEVFQKNKAVNDIVIAAHPDYFPLIERLKKKYGITKLTAIVKGGKERQDSVSAALTSLSLLSSDLVAVHDAARPLLPQAVLTNAVKIAKEKGSALVCIKARDTLLQTSQNSTKYVDRSNVYYVQTPQIFQYGQLMKAMEKARKEKFIGTDESMLMRRAKFHVEIVEGSMLNFKVTTKEDLDLLRKLTGK